MPHTIMTILLTVVLQFAISSQVSQTPQQVAADFLDSMSSLDETTLDQYIDDEYVSFIADPGGSEETDKRLAENIFLNFDYSIDDAAFRDDIAVVKATVTNSDFSKVLDKYDKKAYSYIKSNLSSDTVADKEKLSQKCLDIYVKQIEKAAKGDKRYEATAYIPMIRNEYESWDVVIYGDFMKVLAGGLELP